MDNLEAIISSLRLEKKIIGSEIPSVDLYMDQVTQLFERTYQESKRNDSDKVLTKTMINNYAKGKLIFPIKNKKYTKEHIMLIELIYQLKGGLSINDVRLVLTKLNTHIEAEEINLEEIYDQYTQLTGQQAAEFATSVQSLASDVDSAMESIDSDEAKYVEQLFLIVSLVNQSVMYRKLAEKLVDQLYQPSDNSGTKKEQEK